MTSYLAILDFHKNSKLFWGNITWESLVNILSNVVKICACGGKAIVAKFQIR